MHMNTHVLRKASFMRTGLVKIPKRASQLLMQDAVIESYAVLALYYNSQL